MSSSSPSALQPSIQLLASETEGLCSSFRQTLESEAKPFEQAQALVQELLGVKVLGESKAQFAFWVPGLADGRLQGKEASFQLELWTAESEQIPYQQLKKGETTQLRFQRSLLPMKAVGNYLVGVYEGLRTGYRERWGSFYWVRYQANANTTPVYLRDPLLQSCPFGLYAPAEVYDMERFIPRAPRQSLYAELL